MSVADEQITRLFKARRTLLQMLRDRGFHVEDSDIEMTRHQFVQRFGENIHLKRDELFIETNKGEGPLNRIYVFFPEKQKVGVPVVRDCVQRMKTDNVFNSILVVQTALMAPARAAIAEINAHFRMEFFEEAELLSNITEHTFVPKHTVLNDEEKKELLDKYRVKDTQLPRILVSDPVARYYGLRRGQIVKIVRKSPTADTYVTYRYAV